MPVPARILQPRRPPSPPPRPRRRPALRSPHFSNQPQGYLLMAAAATAAAQGAGDTSAVVVRIFVGGLAEGVSAADLGAVFGSVGRVAGVEFVRTNGRSFAYVDFHCPSDKALAKLFSTYNGCKWKGGKLKLEKAKEHYLTRLKREWEQEAAAAAAEQEMPVKDSVEKQEEKRKLDKDALDISKINIYFPKMRKVKALTFKGSGKHKYSFRNIEVPSYPIHFCDCEEHCGPPEKANDEYASVLNAVAYEKERNIMNSVMSKLFEKDNEHFDSSEINEPVVDINTMETSDAKNGLQIEETEANPEEDFDDLQMEESEEPSEEELDDDLVINIVPRKSKNSALQLDRGKQALNMNEHSGKRQQFGGASPQKKRQKTEGLSEPRNKKLSTSMTSDRRAAGKSPAIAGALQDEGKSPVLSGKRTHESSAVLDIHKSSADLHGVDALTRSSTNNEGAQNVLATEHKKASVWTQKSAWRDLVGGMGSASFSISQVLPNINPAPVKHQNPVENPASRAESRKKAKLAGKSSKFSEATTQPSTKQNLPNSTGMPSTGTTVESAGHETGERSQNQIEEVRVVPKITISEVCPFMRNKESEQQWSKAKKVLTGFIKKGNESVASNPRKGKPPSRR